MEILEGWWNVPAGRGDRRVPELLQGGAQALLCLTTPLVPAVHAQKQNRQTCVRKSLICAFAMAFIISVMLIAANQILRSGME